MKELTQEEWLEIYDKAFPTSTSDNYDLKDQDAIIRNMEAVCNAESVNSGVEYLLDQGYFYKSTPHKEMVSIVKLIRRLAK